MNLLGQYRPGHTWLHRLPAGAKLLALVLASIVVIGIRSPWLAVGTVGVALLLNVVAGTGARMLLAQLRGLLLVVVLLGAWQTWQNGPARAVESIGDLVGLVLLATVLTVTTPVDRILDVVLVLLGPLRPLGVDPQRVALAFSLMLRFLPATMELATQTGDAARARGLERSPRARLVPLVIRVVGNARATGEALDARGVTDD